MKQQLKALSRRLPSVGIIMPEQLVVTPHVKLAVHHLRTPDLVISQLFELLIQTHKPPLSMSSPHSTIFGIFLDILALLFIKL